MKVASFCTAVLLVPALISGCNNWSGFGFDALQLRRDWPGRGPLETYCALFRKPLR